MTARSPQAHARSSTLALLLVAACSSEVPVAGPKETGYGDMPIAEEGPSSETSNDAGVRVADAARIPVDAELDPGDRDAGVMPIADDGGEPMPSDASAPPSGPPPASSFAYATTREPYPNDWLDVTRPKDLTQFAEPLPVVLWANDTCSRSDAQAYPLFDRWAAAGFVVVSPLASLDQGLLGLLGSLGTTNASDHAAMIDWAAAQNQAGPYAGKLDLDRVVMAGNGCGGVTALAAAATDSRAAAVLALSASSALGGVSTSTLRTLDIPVGFLAGGDSDTASANVERDYDALPSGVPAILVRRSTGDHSTVSSNPTMLGEQAAIALDWMDLVLRGNQQAYLALTSPTVCTKCPAGTYTLASKHLETLPR